MSPAEVATHRCQSLTVRFSPAPYGYEFSHDTDDNGHRLLVPLADEQHVLHKIRGVRADGIKLHQIVRLLN
jgi:hypothetical protein